MLFRLTRSASRFPTMLVLTCSVLCTLPAAAQIVDVTDCRAITDSLARLVCYDASKTVVLEPAPQTSASVPATASIPSAASMPRTAPAPAVVPAPVETDSPGLLERGRSLPLVGRLFGSDEAQEQVSAQADEAGSPAQADANPNVDEFGLSRSTAARVQAAEDGQIELHDSIAALDRDRKGNWRITLTSGQVWLQVFEKQFLLREGQAVRIYSTSWGDNFRLTADGRSGFIQVRRVDLPE